MPLDEQRKRVDQETTRMKEEVKKIQQIVQGMPFEVMKQSELEAQLKSKGVKNFVDPNFPPLDSSIYDNIHDEYPFPNIVHWRRPKEFMKTAPQLFLGGIDPNDIKQGALADCWFLSSVACMAERPILIERLFITKEYNDYGIYKIRLCKNGEWIVVTVDDYIPCYYNAGPMFSRSNGDELWVLLLEKAYAKLHGNYWCLRFGLTQHGLIDMTGCPSFP